MSCGQFLQRFPCRLGNFPVVAQESPVAFRRIFRFFRRIASEYMHRGPKYMHRGPNHRRGSASNQAMARTLATRDPHRVIQHKVTLPHQQRESSQHNSAQRTAAEKKRHPANAAAGNIPRLPLADPSSSRKRKQVAAARHDEDGNDGLHEPGEHLHGSGNFEDEEDNAEGGDAAADANGEEPVNRLPRDESEFSWASADDVVDLLQSCHKKVFSSLYFVREVFKFLAQIQCLRDFH